jgi:formyltetrahydrofolate hydrolase
MSNNVRLLVTGPGRKGLIAAVSSFVEAHNGYILEVDEHLNSPASGKWFMRIEIEGESFDLDREEFGVAFAPLARRHEHCLLDLLWRWDAGEPHAEIPWWSPTTRISLHGWRREASGVDFVVLAQAVRWSSNERTRVTGRAHLAFCHRIDAP